MPSLASLRARNTLYPGTIKSFAGGTVPSGWLVCDGSAVSRATYAALFGIVGTTYGIGNGTTTFNVPDLRGRVVAGKDDMGGVAASRLTSSGLGVAGSTLGAAGGTETYTLGIGEIPAHSHTGSVDPASTGTSTESATHTHSGTSGGPSIEQVYRGGTSVGNGGTVVVTAGYDLSHSHGLSTGGQSVNHTHTVDIAATALSIANAGSGSAHKNVQPSFIVNLIIKT